jgi:hypothetical protein
MNREIIIKLFEYFYQEVYHRKNFEFIPSSKELVTIDKFVELLQEVNSLGEYWLFKYFSFQFKYWSEMKYKKFDGVLVSYILGIKAFERFDNKNKDSDYFVDEFIRKYRLDSDKVFGSSYYKKDLLKISVAEEIEKQRIFIHSMRLANCMLNTTMYNKLSEICMLCSKIRMCKIIQKEKYPEVYNLRNDKNIEKISGEVEEEERSLC